MRLHSSAIAVAQKYITLYVVMLRRCVMLFDVVLYRIMIDAALSSSLGLIGPGVHAEAARLEPYGELDRLLQILNTINNTINNNTHVVIIVIVTILLLLLLIIIIILLMIMLLSLLLLDRLLLHDVRHYLEVGGSHSGGLWRHARFRGPNRNTAAESQYCGSSY